LLKGKGLLKGENELLKGKYWREIAEGKRELLKLS
jgi:hypothetical protein